MVLGDVDGVPSTPQTGPNKGYKTWGEPLLSQSGLLSSAGSEAICFLPSSPPGIAKYTLYIKGQNTFNILRMLANYRCFVPFRESTYSWKKCQIFTAKYCNGLLDLGGSPPLHEMPAATVSLKVLTADCSSVWKLSASSSAVGETDTHHGTFNK